MGGLRPDRCHSPMAVQLRSVSVTVTLASIEWAELVATRNHFRNVATGAVSVAPFRSSQSSLLICAVKCGLGLMGGAWARLAVVVVCARAPSLISVRDSGWFRVGDMMVDGVIPLGEALRPLGL